MTDLAMVRAGARPRPVPGGGKVAANRLAINL